MSAVRSFRLSPFGGPVAAPRSLGKPAAVYPGAVATDSDMIVAVDRQQTRLAVPLNTTDTSMTVADASMITAYNLLSIDNEIVKTTASPAGNVVPIQRGFDGTAPALHLAGAAVSGLIDAYHHNRLVAEVEAIEQTLGPNLNRIPASLQTISSAYIFTPQTPGGSLTPGTNVITLNPVPPGVNGTDKSHYLWITGGTGAPEAVLITGGTAVAGAPTGTLFFSCANAHTGAWTISTATSGIQEAIQKLDTAGNGGTVYIPEGNWPTHAPVMIDAPFISLEGAGRGSAVITADLNVCPVIQVGTGNRGVPTYNGIARLSVTRAAGTIPSNCVGVLWWFFNMGWAENVEYSRHYIGEKTSHPAGSICIGFFSDLCTMWGNTYANVHAEHVAGVKYSRLYMGSSIETQPGQTAPTNGVVISADANDIKFDRCDWLSPVTAPATQMKWGILFTAMPSGTGYFVFTDCNWENLGTGVFTSDATCAGINWLEVDFGRDGNSGSAFFTQFNAATALSQVNLLGATINSQIQLTNPKWSRITNCLLGGRMTIAGGDILISNNVFLSNPFFTGTFRCLNLGTNSYVFDGTQDIHPDLSGAAGQIYVESEHDTESFYHPLVSRPEGLAPALAGTALTLSDNFCTITTGGTVATIAAPYPDFSGIAYIAISSNPVTFTTTGNIATSLSAPAGKLVTAAFSKSQSKWFLS